MSPVVKLASAPVQRGQNLWTWDGVISRLAGLWYFPVRMVVAGYPLPHGKLGLVVIAPLNPSQEVVQWLEDTGDVNFVVVPNKQHCWWAAAMKTAFPGSLLVAPLGVSLAVKTLPVDVRVTPLAGPQDLPGSWPLDTLDVMPIPGIPLLEELVLLHKPSSTLILTDLAFNLPQQQQQQQQDKSTVAEQRHGHTTETTHQQAPVKSAEAQDLDKQQQQQREWEGEQEEEGLALCWWVRTYLSLAGGHRRCCLTTPFKYLIKDPGALKDSLDQLLSSWEFNQVSMAHGAFISSGGKQAFTQGTVAFVNELQQRRHTAAAAAAAGGATGLAGTGAAVAVAAMVIGTAVGVGLAGIMQARSGS